jgi:hypothetical protein
MKRSDLELWLELGHYGKPRCEERFALWVEGSLTSGELLQTGSDKLSKEAEESIVWNYVNCIKALTNASQARDGNFFRTLADGFDTLKKNDPVAKRNPASFLLNAYLALAKDRSYLNTGKRRKALPVQAKVTALAQRLCAITRLTGETPADPFTQYPPEFETKIATEIKDLPATKWSRELKNRGLYPLPRAKPGPKAA